MVTRVLLALLGGMRYHADRPAAATAATAAAATAAVAVSDATAAVVGVGQRVVQALM